MVRGKPIRYETNDRSLPLGRLLAAIVAFEAAYLLVRSLAFLVRFEPNYPLWPMAMASAILWPLTFGWAAYVLWRPKLAERRREALLRSVPVWLVMFLNLLLLVALLDRPEMVLRSPL